MLSRTRTSRAAARGTSMVEVLVTMVILAFGLLGVAALQSRLGVAEMESYQRAQALLTLTQMAERINANPTQAANYLGTFGTGDTQPTNCALAFPIQGPNRDLCEWSSALKGAAEQSSGANVGGMQGARGCVTQLQAPNPALGVCTAGVYQVAVAWQGLVPTVIPTLACGAGSYGADDSLRRVVSTTVSVPTTSCY
jgi:type IV pilus assembly protein PilV